MSSGGADMLERLARAFDAAAVRYALIGAAARNAWAPPRLTTDLDVAVAAEAAEYERIETSLAVIGYAVLSSHRADPADPVPAVTIFRNAAAPPPYRQVDVLVAGTEFERQAIDRALERSLGNTTVRVITREDLIIYKLIAWRPRDRHDIEDVIATAEVAGVALDLAHIRRWASAWDVEDRLEQALAGAAGRPP